MVQLGYALKFHFNGLDARLRHGHINYKSNLLMMGKHFYAGRMVEFSMLFKVDPDFPDVLGFYILLQAPGEHPANNPAPVILKEGTHSVEIFSMAQGVCGIFSREMA